jgi:hypothetical protein
MTDQELKDLVASLAVAQAKTEAENAKSKAVNEAGFAALREVQAKTDAGFAAMREAQAKTEAGFAAMREAQARADALRAKNDVQYDKTDAKLDRLAKLYGGVADNLGSSAEEYFYNSLAETKQIGDIHFDNIYERVKGGDPSNQLEYDIVLVNGNCAALVEVKYKVHATALTQVERQLNQFKTHFPKYAGMKLYGGVAGFSVPDEVVQAAHDKGYFVLKRTGDAFAVDTQGMRAF